MEKLTHDEKVAKKVVEMKAGPEKGKVPSKRTKSAKFQVFSHRFETTEDRPGQAEDANRRRLPRLWVTNDRVRSVASAKTENGRLLGMLL